MTCSRYEELLSARIDGELTDTEASELQAHLGACATCRDRLDAMINQQRALSAYGAPGQPEGLRARITKRIGLKARVEREIRREAAPILGRFHFPCYPVAEKKTVESPLMGRLGRM